jgi:kynurenine formamidase
VFASLDPPIIILARMVNLEELARDGVYSFLFVVSPLKIVGGTGSPVRPIAIV